MRAERVDSLRSESLHEPLDDACELDGVTRGETRKFVTNSLLQCTPRVRTPIVGLHSNSHDTLPRPERHGVSSLGPGSRHCSNYCSNPQQQQGLA